MISWQRCLADGSVKRKYFASSTIMNCDLQEENKKKYKSMFLKAVKSEILVKDMMKEMSEYSASIGEYI